MQLQSNNYKQIIQMKRNMIKDPNWQGVNQLAIYKSGREVELEATEKQIQLEARQGLELGSLTR